MTLSHDTKRSITLELHDQTLRYLEVLTHSDAVSAGARVEDVLSHLACSAADGVRRAGAWEREWVHQAFGYSWNDRLVRDPNCEWQMIPDLDDDGDEPAA